jgi:hypothetical protein
MKKYIENFSIILPIIMFILLKSHNEIKNYAKKTCINLGCSFVCFIILFLLLSKLNISRYSTVCICIVIYLLLIFIQKKIKVY